MQSVTCPRCAKTLHSDLRDETGRTVVPPHFLSGDERWCPEAESAEPLGAGRHIASGGRATGGDGRNAV